MKVVEAKKADIPIVKKLFLQYTDWLNIDLCFQDFDAELSGLPGRYAPPNGAILLAKADGNAVGCVALRPLAENVCEMKRLYVSPGFQGLGIGKALVEKIIEKARSLKYKTMRLDTLSEMTAARALYRSVGFKPIGAYYPNPLKGVEYLELKL